MRSRPSAPACSVGRVCGHGRWLQGGNRAHARGIHGVFAATGQQAASRVGSFQSLEGDGVQETRMDSAEISFYVLWAVATFVWLLALRTMTRLTRERQGLAAGNEWEGLEAAPPANVVAGTTEVAGQPAGLSAKAASY